MASIYHTRWMYCLIVFFICTKYADASKLAKIMVHSPKDVELIDTDGDAPQAMMPVIQCGNNQCDMTKQWCDEHLRICQSCEAWCSTSQGICENNCQVFLAHQNLQSIHSEDQPALNGTAQESAGSNEERYTLKSCNVGTNPATALVLLAVVVLVLSVLLLVMCISTARIIYLSGENLTRGGQLKSKIFPQWMQCCMALPKERATHLYASVSTSTDDVEAGTHQHDIGSQTQGNICQPVDDADDVANPRNVRYQMTEDRNHQPDFMERSRPFMQQQPADSADERQWSRPQTGASVSHSESTVVKEVDSNATTRNRSFLDSVEDMQGTSVGSSPSCPSSVGACTSSGLSRSTQSVGTGSPLFQDSVETTQATIESRNSQNVRLYSGETSSTRPLIQHDSHSS